MRHANGEHRGYCLECIADMRDGGEHPVCRASDPAEGGLWCAWCGHEVTA